MRRPAVLLTSLIAAAWLATACSNKSDRVTTPSAGAPGDAIGSPPARTPAPPQTPPGTATCDATKARFAIGQRASDVLLEKARVAAQADSARFLRPDQPITLEFLGSRLNLKLDRADVVNGVSCG